LKTALPTKPFLIRFAKSLAESKPSFVEMIFLFSLHLPEIPQAPAMTKAKIETVLMRTGPCRCGCKGTDPWHRRTLKRAVAQTSETEGTISAPWGSVEVRRKEYQHPETGKPIFGGWLKVGI
jgi:hypothetical protein